MAEAQSIVLGIDAAWTVGQPSGVALVRGQGASWQCLARAPSYASFGTRARAHGDGTAAIWA